MSIRPSFANAVFGFSERTIVAIHGALCVGEVTFGHRVQSIGVI
ncbi:hypothetical protein [Paracoccus sp. WLY502]|nr:hypothetical protein [Paracoccus sp. WLY502]